MVDVRKGSLDIEVDWAPELMRGMRLKDFPSFTHILDVNNIMINFMVHAISQASQASAIVIKTFEDLEQPSITALKTMLPPIYSTGPLSLLTRNKVSNESPLATINMNLWKQDDSCFYWLDSHNPCSVVYVNFGAVLVMSNEQLREFAWGLANSRYNFLWVIRLDLVKEQPTNCKYTCVEWGLGMEINNNVKREEVEALIREIMAGEQKGKKNRNKTEEWKDINASGPNGVSEVNFERMVKDVFLDRKVIN